MILWLTYRTITVIAPKSTLPARALRDSRRGVKHRESSGVDEARVQAFGRLAEAEQRLHVWWEQRHETTWVTELLGSPVEE
jgi:hypothetical protein